MTSLTPPLNSLPFAVRHDPLLVASGYCGVASPYSPHEAYPEYEHGDLATAPNYIYSNVRQLLYDAGLDRDRFGTPDWNPLGTFVAPGSQVFVLANFVQHRLSHQSEETQLAKCTHGSVLRPVLDYALKACGPSGRVLFGNAPIQSCDWDHVLMETGAASLPPYFAKRGLPVFASDLRARRVRIASFGRQVLGSAPAEPAVTVDLGARSLLQNLSSGAAGLRVTDYDPRATERAHFGSHHIYYLHPEILRSDTVLSLPKLKTHEKVGITVAIKGFVGAVMDKSCLAHHRLGDPRGGGDEYPQATPLLRLSSWFNENSATSDRWLQRSVLSRLDRALRWSLRRRGIVQAGAWQGNDTCWRMAVDLAFLLRHCDATGRIHDKPVRSLPVIVDGIVAGDQDGPLSPHPVAAGLMMFSPDPGLADRASALVMGFDPELIPHVRESSRVFPRQHPQLCLWNGEPVEFDQLPSRANAFFRSPSGWRGYIEWRSQ